MAVNEFSFRTGKVRIILEKCKGCKSLACVKACSLFGRNLLKIQDGKPALIIGPEEAPRACIECLACGLYCQDYGNKGLEIILEMFGLDEHRKKLKLETQEV